MWKLNDQHVTSVGQRKNLSPQQDSNLWPPKPPGGHSIHLSYGELIVHIWHVSCILLGSAMSMSHYVMKEMKDGKF